MPITHSDISTDEDLGRRVLVRAGVIAPCLATLDPETEAGKNAIAILKGVISELPAAGSRRTRALSRNGTSMSFAAIDAAFDADARLSLQAICGVATGGALPAGHFPKARPLRGIWPDEEYS